MSRDEQARARELVMAAYAEAGMQPQPWFLHDDPASFRGSDYFLFKAIIEALRGASGGGVDATAMERLRIMSKQKLASEMEDHEIDCADWRGGYECLVNEARAVFASIAPDHPAENAKSSGEERASYGVAAIATERQRQIEQEGWTPEHDDEHRDDLALPRAAACYALAGTGGNGPFWITHLQTPQQVWPYRWEWKPKDRRSNLVRAGALIAAEIDRLDRAALTRSGKGEG